MNKLLVLFVVLTLMAVSVKAEMSSVELDFVNIGDTISEVDHGITSWSNIWTWGGNYGGGDDGTLRTVLPRSADCMTDEKEAFFTLTTSGTASNVELRHLMGSQNDAYELYVKDGATWTKLSKDSSTDEVCSGGECWYTDSYDLSGRTGTLEFKIYALTVPASWCESWGLNAFSWARLNGIPETTIPEFGVIAGAVALIGALGIFVYRRIS